MYGSPSHSPNADTNAYLRTKVMTASAEELRLMLLDGRVALTAGGSTVILRAPVGQ